MRGATGRLSGTGRRGSLFAIVLIVLFVATVVVGAMQLLTVDTLRQTRQIAQGDDETTRAEGLRDLLISRWKKQLGYSFTVPGPAGEDGSEAGQWESHAFVMGWTRGPLRGDPPSAMACIWVRFLDAHPLRTIRFDLQLRAPTALADRYARVIGETPDEVDPSSSTARQAAYAAVVAAGVRPPDREAAVEAVSRRVRDLADRGATPAQVEAQCAPAALTATAGAISRYLAARAMIGAASDPADRVTRARAALDAARAVPAPDGPSWQGAAQCDLAQALSRASESPPATGRFDALDEAARLLDDALSNQKPPCGASQEAWWLAEVLMKRRRNLRDPTELAQARDDARRRLQGTTSGRTSARVSGLSDITAGELPGLFDAVWAPRIAMGVETMPGRYVLASMKPDGSAPLVHLEASVPIQPLAYTADASAIDVAIGEPWRIEGQSVCRVSVDGSRVTSVLGAAVELPSPSYPDPGPTRTVAPGGWRWLEVFGVQEGPDGVGSVVHGEGLFGSPGQYGVYAGALSLRAPDVHGVPVQFWDGFTLSSAVVSPGGTRMAVVSSKHGFDYVHTYVTLFDTADGSGAGLQVATVPLPSAFLSNGWFSGLSWESYPTGEWIAYVTVVGGDSVQVVFVDPSRPPDQGVTIRSLSLPMQVAEVNDVLTRDPPGAVGTLLASPAGFVVATRDRLHFEPLPGTAGRAADWPLTGATGVGMLAHLHASPSGGLLAFSNSTPDGGAVLVRDTATGETRVLAGPGGRFPAARSAAWPAVSPLP